jgi:NAD(P)H-dependent flavin oxidoreductase YrpB (nitropropane dioxygenase family)
LSRPLDTTLRTPLCEQLGIDVPIVQAPIGSAATPELVSAVGNAGALGVLALTWVSIDEAESAIRRVRALTRRPFAVNFVLEFPIDRLLEASLAEGVPIVSTFWGPRASLGPHQGCGRSPPPYGRVG